MSMATISVQLLSKPRAKWELNYHNLIELEASRLVQKIEKRTFKYIYTCIYDISDAIYKLL